MTNIKNLTDEQKLNKIVELYDQLNPLMQGFPSLVNRLKTIKDDLDTQHRDAYHALEELNMNAAEMAKWGKYTKRMAKERRKNKLLWELADSMQKEFDSKGKEPSVGSTLTNLTVAIQNKKEDIKKKAIANGVDYLQKIDKARVLSKNLGSN